MWIMKKSKIHFNKPQLRSWLIQAPEEIAIWGRGTGKSEGLIAPRSIDNVFAMPRSLGVFVAATYQQLLTRTLPPVIKGWEKLGYKRDRDFFFGQFAPKKWKWELPYTPPLRPDHFIHFRNGSGIALVSQDRPGSANGLSIDWIMGDEAKYLKEQRYHEELLPANRGNGHLFQGIPQHHSILLCTDMPVATSGKWVLKKQDQYDEPQYVERQRVALAIQAEIYDLRQRVSKSKSPAHKKNLTSKIGTRLNQLALIRSGNPGESIPRLRLFSRASALENIDVLGVDYFEQMRTNMTDLVYQTSILNQELKSIEHGFYPDLDEEQHGYDLFDNSYLEALDYNFQRAQEVDSRQDADVMHAEPLDIALDYGASLNCIVVGQRFDDEYRFLNGLHVKHPQKLSHLITKFKRYYRYHKNKRVNFFYDHTAAGQNAVNDIRYYQEVIDLLERKDEHGSWIVTKIYLGQTPSHHARYEFWGKVLTDSDPAFPRFRYNRHNCQSWFLSCAMAPVREGRKGFEKDKSSEKRIASKDGDAQRYRVEQEKATHYSDAGDTLIYGKLKSSRSATTQVVGTFMG